jgi:hypothetical protein
VPKRKKLTKSDREEKSGLQDGKQEKKSLANSNVSVGNPYLQLHKKNIDSSSSELANEASKLTINKSTKPNLKRDRETPDDNLPPIKKHKVKKLPPKPSPEDPPFLDLNSGFSL